MFWIKGIIWLYQSDVWLCFSFNCIYLNQNNRCTDRCPHCRYFKGHFVALLIKILLWCGNTMTGFRLSSQSLPCLSLPSRNLKIICHHYVAPKKEGMGRNFQSAHLWLCNEPQPEDIQGHLQCRVNEKDYDWCAKKWKYNTVLEKSKRLNCAWQYTTGIQYHLWWGTYSVLMKTGKKWPKNLHHILVKDLIRLFLHVVLSKKHNGRQSYQAALLWETDTFTTFKIRFQISLLKINLSL